METLLYLTAFFIVIFFVFVGFGKLKEKAPLSAMVAGGALFLIMGIGMTAKGIIAHKKGEMVMLRGEGQPPIQAIIGGAFVSVLSSFYITTKVVNRNQNQSEQDNPITRP
jgi:hypothetical protein